MSNHNRFSSAYPTLPMDPPIHIEPGDWIRCKYCSSNYPVEEFLPHRETCVQRIRKKGPVQPQQHHRSDNNYENIRPRSSTVTERTEKQDNSNMTKSPSPPLGKFHSVSTDTNGQIKKDAVPLVDLTLSDDEDEVLEFSKAFRAASFENDDTANSVAASIPSNLLKCNRCEEYFFTREELINHCDNYHSEELETETEGEKNASNKNLIVESRSETEKLQNGKRKNLDSDNFVHKLSFENVSKPNGHISPISPTGKGSLTSSTKEPSTSELISSSGITVPSVLFSSSSGRNVNNEILENNKPNSCPLIVTNNMEENNSKDKGKSKKQQKGRKNPPPTLEYYVQREAAKKKFQYSDNICPYCQKDFKTTSRLESHISSKHERSFVESPSKKVKAAIKRFEKLNATRKLMGGVMKKYKKPNEKQPCTICSTWLTRSAMAYHVLVHTGEKPFSCQYCNSAYRSKYCKVKHESCCTFKTSCLDTTPVYNQRSQPSGSSSHQNKILSRDFQTSKRSMKLMSKRNREENGHGLLNYNKIEKVTASHLEPVQPQKSMSVSQDIFASDEIRVCSKQSEENIMPRVVHSQTASNDSYSKLHNLSSTNTNKSSKQQVFRKNYIKTITNENASTQDTEGKNNRRRKAVEQTRTKSKVASDNNGMVNPGIAEKHFDGLEKITEQKSRPLNEILAPFLEIDCVDGKQDNVLREVAQEEAESGLPKNNYRCLVCQEVLEGETSTRQHMRYRHGRIMQSVLQTEGNSISEKQVITLCKEIASMTDPKQMHLKRKSQGSESEIPALAESVVDESRSRLIVKTRGNEILSCALLTPPESVIINNETGTKQSEKESLRCEFCSRTFQSHAMYLFHAVQHKGVSFKNCIVCSKAFVHSDHYFQHMQSVHNLDLFPVCHGVNTAAPSPNQEAKQLSGSADVLDVVVLNTKEIPDRLLPSSLMSDEIVSDVQKAIIPNQISNLDHSKKTMNKESCGSQGDCEVVPSMERDSSSSVIASAMSISSEDIASIRSDRANFVPPVTTTNVTFSNATTALGQEHRNIKDATELHPVVQNSFTDPSSFPERASVISSNIDRSHNSQFYHSRAVAFPCAANQRLQNGNYSNTTQNTVYNFNLLNPKTASTSLISDRSLISNSSVTNTNEKMKSLAPFSDHSTISRFPSPTPAIQVLNRLAEGQDVPYIRPGVNSNSNCNLFPHSFANRGTEETSQKQHQQQPYLLHQPPLHSLSHQFQSSNFASNTPRDQLQISSYVSPHQDMRREIQNNYTPLWEQNLPTQSYSFQKQTINHHATARNSDSHPHPSNQVTAQNLYDRQPVTDQSPNIRTGRVDNNLRGIYPCTLPSTAYAQMEMLTEVPILTQKQLSPTIERITKPKRAYNKRASFQTFPNGNSNSHNPETTPLGFDSLQASLYSKSRTNNNSTRGRPRGRPRKNFPNGNNNVKIITVPPQSKKPKSSNSTQNATHERKACEPANGVYNFVGGTVLQKIPVPSNILDNGMNNIPEKVAKPRNDNLLARQEHFSPPKRVPFLSSNSVPPLSGEYPMNGISYPVNGNLPEGALVQNGETLANYSHNQVIYQEGSKSKMLNRRQCSYCYNSYQSQLALQEHVNVCHKDPSQQSVFVSDPSQQSQLVITAIY